MVTTIRGLELKETYRSSRPLYYYCTRQPPSDIAVSAPLYLQLLSRWTMTVIFTLEFCYTTYQVLYLRVPSLRVKEVYITKKNRWQRQSTSASRPPSSTFPFSINDTCKTENASTNQCYKNVLPMASNKYKILSMVCVSRRMPCTRDRPLEASVQIYITLYKIMELCYKGGSHRHSGVRLHWWIEKRPFKVPQNDGNHSRCFQDIVLSFLENPAWDIWKQDGRI